jgi:hypothetical protein
VHGGYHGMLPNKDLCIYLDEFIMNCFDHVVCVLSDP